MNTVIGLLPRKCNHLLDLKKLYSVGFDEDDVFFLNNEEAIQTLLNCELTNLIKRYVKLGVSIWLIILYSIIGLLANVYSDYRLIFYEKLPIIAVGFVVLVGIVICATLGCLIGKFECKRDVHHYIQGVRHGDKAIKVNGTPRDVNKAKRILEHGCAICVRIIPERSRDW